MSCGRSALEGKSKALNALAINKNKRKLNNTGFQFKRVESELAIQKVKQGKEDAQNKFVEFKYRVGGE